MQQMRLLSAIILALSAKEITSSDQEERGLILHFQFCSKIFIYRQMRIRYPVITGH